MAAVVHGSSDGSPSSAWPAERDVFDHLLPRGRERFSNLMGGESGKLIHFMLNDAGELSHAKRTMLQRNLAICLESCVCDSNLRLQGLLAQRLEAAEEFAGCGIDGLDRHALRIVALLV